MYQTRLEILCTQQCARPQGPYSDGGLSRNADSRQVPNGVSGRAVLESRTLFPILMGLSATGLDKAHPTGVTFPHLL